MNSILATRRHVLRGFGALLPLPVLPSLFAKQSYAATAPKTWIMLYLPNGVYRNDWMIKASADGAPELPTFLVDALGSVRKDIVWVNGLSNSVSGQGGHETASGGVLSCRNMQLPGPVIAKTADQIVADQLGAKKPIPTLTLSAPGRVTSASCCTAAEPAMNAISWRGSAATKLIDPQVVFDRMFPGATDTGSAQEKALRLLRRKSILDFNNRQATRLQSKLGTEDKTRLAQYFDSIRDVEKSLEPATALPTTGCIQPARPQPVSTSSLDFDKFHQTMLDLVFVGAQCEITPVTTFLQDLEFSGRIIKLAGLGNTQAGHHGVSHHEDDPVKVGQFRIFQAFYATRFAGLVDRLKTARGPEGRPLLDDTLVTFNAGLGDGNSHSLSNVPFLLAGGTAAGVKPGRVVSVSQPLGDMWRTVMRTMGASGSDVDSFGKTTGEVHGIFG